jgi:hypothetical protein
VQDDAAVLKHVRRGQPPAASGRAEKAQLVTLAFKDLK